MGAEGLYRSRLLEVGAFADHGGLFSSMTTVGSSVGVGKRWDSGLHVSLRLSGGVHFYHDAGRKLFSDNPGTAADLPFLGVRSGVRYAFGSSTRHFELGLIGFAEQDLFTKTETVHYTETPLFDDARHPTTATNTAGGFRAGAALRLAFVSDSL